MVGYSAGANISSLDLEQNILQLGMAASSETSPRPQAQADSKHRNSSSTNALGSIDLNQILEDGKPRSQGTHDQ